MLNKNYKVSYGFILLIFTMAFVGTVVLWAFSPLDSERILLNADKGHNFYKAKEYNPAFSSFLKAGELTSDSKQKSIYYRLAAQSLNQLGEFDTAIVYYRKALDADPNNALAKNAIEWLYNTNKITHKTNKVVVDKDKGDTYFNRSKGGWSMGRKAGVEVAVIGKNVQKYVVDYYTAGPLKSGYLVNILVNGDLISTKNVVRGGRYSELLYLSEGLHIVDIEISDTFNPKKLGWSEDDRDLGVNFKIKKETSE